MTCLEQNLIFMYYLIRVLKLDLGLFFLTQILLKCLKILINFVIILDIKMTQLY